MSDWQLDGLPGDVRLEAETAAQRDGLPLHRWLGKLIRDTCAEEGVALSRELSRATSTANGAAGAQRRVIASPIAVPTAATEEIIRAGEARAAEPTRAAPELRAVETPRAPNTPEPSPSIAITAKTNGHDPVSNGHAPPLETSAVVDTPRGAGTRATPRATERANERVTERAPEIVPEYPNATTRRMAAELAPDLPPAAPPKLAAVTPTLITIPVPTPAAPPARRPTPVAKAPSPSETVPEPSSASTRRMAAELAPDLPPAPAPKLTTVPPTPIRPTVSPIMPKQKESVAPEALTPTPTVPSPATRRATPDPMAELMASLSSKPASVTPIPASKPVAAAAPPVSAIPPAPPPPSITPAAPPPAPAVGARTDDRQAALVKLVHNLQRNELSPIGEARLYLKLMTEYMASIAELTVATGRTQEQISRSLRLLGLSDRIRDLVDRGALTRDQAFAMLDADNPEATNPVVPPSVIGRTQ